MTIIMLYGKRFSGKDTIASMLPSMKRVAIADSLKYEYMNAHPGIDMFKREDKEKYRLDMIQFGLEKPFSYWLERAPYEDNCIVTDLRTMEEIEYVKQKFVHVQVLLIKVVCDDEQRMKRGWTHDEAYDNNPLETALDSYDGFDLVVQNNTPDDLNVIVQQLNELK
jgi:phosphomevalonate kinase